MLSPLFLALLGLSLILLGMLICRSPAKEKTYALDANDGSTDLEEKRTEVKGGAVVMIGPIPIVMGSDSRTALLIMLMAVGVMLFWFMMISSSWR